jgi:AcrR family transcriptional regulator
MNKKSASKKPVNEAAARLSRDDWLDAAFGAVVDGGFDAVRVLVLADKLGVTRGSFYWHFDDHADLLTALVARWRERELASNAKVAANHTHDAHADLQSLLEAALAHAGADLENMRFELALRGLGRRDATVARTLVEIDAVRMTLFEQKFLALTGNPGSASELAALFYMAIVGCHQALSRPINPPNAKDYLQGIITRYLISAQGAKGR